MTLHPRSTRCAAALVAALSFAPAHRVSAALPALASAEPSPLSAERAGSAEAGSVQGVVRAPGGAPVAGVAVTLHSPQGTVAAAQTTGEDGTFRLEAAPGSYVLAAAQPGFATRRLALRVEPGGELRGVLVDLRAETFREEVTVSASPGRADALDNVAQRVNVIGEEQIALQARAVLAQAVAGQVGLNVQRTSPTIGGVFVRGLTGTKVNVYVDGVRYTTSAQRGGISTFFDLVEPESLEAIEVVRGPSSAEYGSDAIGGTVQLLTRAPVFSGSGSRLSGGWSASGGSADASFGSSLALRYAAPTFGISATVAGRRINTLRPGGGSDSHNAATRFLGLPSSALIAGDRLPDTAFTQYGGHLRANWALSPSLQLSGSYLRGQQDGGRRYDQLLGGDGNLVADLRNLMADHFHARLEKLRAGWLDRVTLSYSFSAQREERVNQGGNGNPRANVNHEPERTVAHGLQAAAQRSAGRHDLLLGADAFRETIAAPSFASNPQGGATTPRRGRVPDGARYAHGGVFVQDLFSAWPGRLRLNAAARFSAASYETDQGPASASGTPLWPADAYDTSAFTFRVGALWTVAGPFRLAANVSSGFRAPDVTDIGTFGLTGSGYEVSSREVEGRGATIGSTADATAVSTGRPLDVLLPETSLAYELTARYSSRRVKADLTAFQTDVNDNVAKQALVLPPGAVGSSLGSETVTRQLASGVVYVAASTSPVLARTNFGDARIRGLEATADVELKSWLTLAGSYTWLHAQDRASGLPPNIEGGTPAPEGWLRVRFAPNGGRRFWLEPYLHAAGRQTRLSTLDLEDRRTGATRSRSSIASFFNNGARARGLVSAGPDGVPGNADDVLLPTGETLAQVQLRVLGPGGAPSPLFPALPGYAVVGLRGALHLAAQHELLFDLENLGDVNYRGISWGVDAPGRGLYLRYALRF